MLVLYILNTTYGDINFIYVKSVKCKNIKGYILGKKTSSKILSNCQCLMIKSTLVLNINLPICKFKDNVYIGKFKDNV